MENVVCNFCGSSKTSPVFVLKDIRMGLPGEYKLVQCSQCKLLFLNPQPSWIELKPHYSQEYHCFIPAIEDQPTGLIRWAKFYGVRRRCRAIIKRKKTGRLLDIGCATGVFLNEMRKYPGWEVSGVEPIESAVEFARKRFGLDVFQGTLLEYPYTAKSFDVVTLWDVLEHIPNPRENLELIYQILKPGGFIVIKIPDPLSWEAQLFRANWAGYEAPQHLYHFPGYTLVNQLTLLGFEYIGITLLGGDYSSLMASLGSWLIERGINHPGRWVKSIARSTYGRVLTAPVFTILRILKMGSSKVYFAYKRQP